MKRIRKALAAAAGGAVTFAATATVPDRYAPWVQLAGAIGTVLLVYVAPRNADGPTPPARHMGGQLGG